MGFVKKRNGAFGVVASVAVGNYFFTIGSM